MNAKRKEKSTFSVCKSRRFWHFPGNFGCREIPRSWWAQMFHIRLSMSFRSFVCDGLIRRIHLPLMFEWGTNATQVHLHRKNCENFPYWRRWRLLIATASSHFIRHSLVLIRQNVGRLFLLLSLSVISRWVWVLRLRFYLFSIVSLFLAAELRLLSEQISNERANTSSTRLLMSQIQWHIRRDQSVDEHRPNTI